MANENSFNVQIPGYHLTRILGTGGMGTVYEAVRQKDGARVAVKVCHPHLATLKEFHKRFQREASLALKFQHPGAAAIYDNGVTDTGIPYIVMELVEGEKLSDLMPSHLDDARISQAGKTVATPEAKPHEPIPLPKVIEIIRRIAETLGDAHRAGLYHRDIKPDNIIITPDGGVKILDFGLVKDEASLSTILTQTGRGLGTPAYMSPEQCQGDKKIDGRSDLYSLGVVLYEMATGEQPFRGPTTAAFTRQHIEEIPERPFKRNSRVPENLSLVIDRLLAKNPEDRHQTAQELLEDLDRVQKNQPPKKIYRFKKARRVSPSLVVAGIALALIVLGAGGWLAYGQYQKAKARTAVELALSSADRMAGSGDYLGAIDELQLIKLKHPNRPDLMGDMNKTIAQYNSKAAEQKRLQDAEKKKHNQEEADRLARIEDEKRKAEIERQKRDEEKAEREEADKKRRFESALAESKAAEERNDLRSQVAALESALKYQSDPLAQSNLNLSRAHLDEYTKLIREGREALANPMTFEKAVESFEKALKEWNNDEAANLLAQAKNAIANRRHRIAIIDFAVSGNVNELGAGASVAGLLQADPTIAARYEIIERRQLQKMLEEIKLQMSDLVGDNEKAAEFGRIKGVPYIITGQVIRLGKLSVTAYILEVQTGRQVAQAKVSADDMVSLEAQLPDLSRILCMTPDELKAYETERARLEKLKAADAAYAEAQKKDADASLSASAKKAIWEQFLKDYESVYDKGDTKITAARERAEFWANWKSPTPTPQLTKDFTADLGGGVKLDMKWIPGGSFDMGSNDGDDDEKPVHTVSLDSFWMGATEVTVGQFKRFVNDTGYQTDAEKGTGSGGRGAYTVKSDGTWGRNASASWRSPGISQDDNHPVVCVSWNDASAFCEWLSRKTNQVITLPTEAQWEYACRAGTRTRYFTGDSEASLDGYANAADASAKRKYSNWTCFAWDDGYIYTAPVRNYKPNGFGLYDMTGNVWEWCSDWYGKDYYKNTSGKNPKGPAQGDNTSYTIDGIKWEGGVRVLRGGGWGGLPGYCRSAFRFWYGPENRYVFVGFRVSCSFLSR